MVVLQKVYLLLLIGYLPRIKFSGKIVYFWRSTTQTIWSERTIPLLQNSRREITSLKSFFFLSECCCDATFQRIQEKFNNPLLKPALLFLSSALPLFTHVNQLLQREEPTIHILQFAIEKKRPNVLSYQLKLERFLVFLKLI